MTTIKTPRKVGNVDGDIFYVYNYALRYDEPKEYINKFTATLEAIQNEYGSFESWKLLGIGSYGSAYLLPNDCVVKIQSGKLKRSSPISKLRGKKLKYVEEVLDIKTVNSGNGYFTLILLPKYEKLSSKEERQLCTLLDDFDPRCYRNGSNIDKHVMSMDYYSKRRKQAMIKQLKKFNIVDMIEELKLLKTKHTDWHSGNIMKSSEGYVLIDVDNFDY